MKAVMLALFSCSFCCFINEVWRVTIKTRWVWVTDYVSDTKKNRKLPKISFSCPDSTKLVTLNQLKWLISISFFLQQNLKEFVLLFRFYRFLVVSADWCPPRPWFLENAPAAIYRIFFKQNIYLSIDQRLLKESDKKQAVYAFRGVMVTKWVVTHIISRY